MTAQQIGTDFQHYTSDRYAILITCGIVSAILRARLKRGGAQSLGSTYFWPVTSSATMIVAIIVLAIPGELALRIGTPPQAIQITTMVWTLAMAAALGGAYWAKRGRAFGDI